ncbi:MAG: hypothetical protein VX278_01745 [Myxococcota bacterium]|nr:hypothetical protein [Myxococcota bacterium]
MIFFTLACVSKELDSADVLIQTELSGYVTELLGGEGTEDVSVCSTECATTDGDGFYRLISESSDPQRSLVMSGEDLVSGLVPVLATPPSQTVPNVSLVSPVLIEAQMGMVDLTWTDGTGMLVFSISNGIFGDGVNVPDIVLSTDDDIGDGPFYTNTQGLPSTALTQTSAHGGGVWLNLPPGTHTFTPSNLPAGCTLLIGWGTVEAIEIPILSDHITFMRAECAES